MLSEPNSRKAKVPAYRRRIIHGREKAYLTLTDSRTHRRHDYVLGEYGSAESRERYTALLAEWELRGRRLPEGCQPRAGLTVTELCVRYWREATLEYSQSHRFNIRAALRVLRRLYGSSPARSIGPKRLKRVRAAMAGAEWARQTVNARTHLLIAMFRWAVSEELIGPRQYEAVRALPPLRASPQLREGGRRIRPVPEEWIERVKPYLGATLAAIVDVQRWTGMRPSEVCRMRPCDLEIQGDVWLYAPPAHKTLHLGKSRTIWIGPRARAVLQPLLAGRATTHPVFVATEKPLAPYTKDSYRRAISRACDRAWPPPEHLARALVAASGRKHTRLETLKEWKARLGPEAWKELRAWRLSHRWHPRQLRKNWATEVRRRYGLEAAQILLGHGSAVVTDAAYAERDAAKAREVVLAMG